MNPRTAAALLRATPLDALDARVLLTHALGWRRTDLITRGDAPLSDAQIAAFVALEQRRVAGEPVAQIVGHREFFGLDFEVTRDVLIPRPDTELLVETALLELRARAESRPRVADLGTGSGAIAIAIAHARPDARVIATDRSRAALDVARRNASRLLDATSAGPAIDFREGDWFDALAAEAHADHAEPPRFALIVSNPPYIRAGDPHLDDGDLRFEPVDALTDHGDGLRALRTIVGGARAWLDRGAALWVEHGYDQAADVRALFTAGGYTDVESRRDLAGIERITGGRMPA
ncbi:peptide chain release factor N(5)-glutamine methyltransferase [Pararobbsia silviterrae]|uniref:Release factor glutamine methyltransferase n=1 Tax=Pararobbsia silviterrae TaxID=1792498 RepID=A0A494XC93_9BURK|nr:peptide chain release factor N(5)-glutamine methyltransferase [Pararobbsia silviterrae]RKP45764.1 peptide chain release factor N(5)-glutamine methyltransferase [Pararobbsia silviterrae]